MLSKLIVNNVALIKHLELDFCGKLNILSGETGAGKSIIVDSLMLLLGGKYDKSILRYGEEKGYVEGIFEDCERCASILEEFGFEKEDTVIINRKFNIDGKSDIRINGRAASISMLREIMSVLMDIYGQNEYQSLMKESEHLKIINYYTRNETAENLKLLSAEYANFVRINKELKEIGSISERERNIDILRFQLDEIKKANIKEGEEDKLLEKRKIISSAEKIASVLTSVKDNLLYSDDNTAVQLVDASKKALGGIADFNGIYEELYKRLDSVLIELDDIAQCAADESEKLDFDEKVLEKIEIRLELIRTLKRKYGDSAKMNEFYNFSSALLNKLENSTFLYEKLQKEKTVSIKLLYDLSQKLSQARKAGALIFEKLIIKELRDLGMEGADFKVVFNDFPSIDICEKYISASGFDKVEFYFSANKGQPLMPLVKIISGGEMSRFVLALKVISSQNDEIPTMIFDEVDAGISGKIGQEVAKKLAIISRARQVLCVTHLPQIASMADNHYYISKTVVGDTTQTFVSKLSDNEIYEEISRLSGAKDISTQSYQNATEMKKWSNDFKQTIKN